MSVLWFRLVRQKAHFWFVTGGFLLVCSTALYFGSDDWRGFAKPAATILSWLVYFIGFLIFVICFSRLEGRQLFIAGGLLASIIVLMSGGFLLVPNSTAYLVTHPYALSRYLSGQGITIDSRDLHNWAMMTLFPYQLLLTVTLSFWFIECCVVGGARMLKARRIKKL